MRESVYQAGLIKRLAQRFPGCHILRNDAMHTQGIPDLTILHNDRWAALEVKPSPSAPFQPNQEYYIGEFNRMSFAAVIYPENEEEVLDALQQAFESRRPARVPKRKQVPLDQL